MIGPEAACLSAQVHDGLSTEPTVETQPSDRCVHVGSGGFAESVVMVFVRTGYKLTADVALTDPNAGSLFALWHFGYEGLNTVYELKPGAVWTLPITGNKILIRDNFPRLMELLCHDMSLESVDADSTPSNRNKGLLVGTPGTGVTTFMWVLAIQVMKMALAPAHLPCRAAFNPKVQSVRFQWPWLHGGCPLYLGKEPGGPTCVVLYHAGTDENGLPPSQLEFAIGASSTGKRQYRRWCDKDCVWPRYYKPWQWSELVVLSRNLSRNHGTCTDNLSEKFKIIGGNPQGLFGRRLSELTQEVKQRLRMTPVCDPTLLERLVFNHTDLVGGQLYAYPLLQVVPRDLPEDTEWGDQLEGSVRLVCVHVWVVYAFLTYCPRFPTGEVRDARNVSHVCRDSWSQSYLHDRGDPS